ncbi:signal peptidase I [bacterium]|nr:signal peptidase I [bacterium]
MENKRAGSTRRWWLAGLLSYLVPGLGQVYNGQAGKGLLFNFLFTTWGGVVFAVLIRTLKLPVTAGSAAALTGLFLLGLAAQLVVAIEAMRGAVRIGCGFTPRKYNTPLVYAGVLAVCLTVQASLSSAIGEHILKAFRIPTGSMTPTLEPGDHVLSNQLYFTDHNPAAGDVVIFKSPEDGKSNFIKRITGMPGDTVAMAGGRWVVNGKPASDPAFTGTRADTGAFGPVVVPRDAYFVTGDNPDHSRDSRQFGPVPRHLIRGKPVFVYFSSNGPFRWRLGRTGKIVQ